MKVMLMVGGNAPNREAKLTVSPTEGPRSMQIMAYWESGYAPCGDSDCADCRNLIQGFGATE